MFLKHQISITVAQYYHSTDYDLLKYIFHQEKSK